MRHDRQQESGFKPGRDNARREWEPAAAEQHQMEAREHARPAGRARRALAQREAEATRQIRALGGRAR